MTNPGESIDYLNRLEGPIVDDVRRGLPPRFDLHEADPHWAYERGRAWATIAPKDLDPRSNLAVRLLEAAFGRKWII